MLKRYIYPILKLFLFCIFWLFTTQLVYGIGYRTLYGANALGSLTYLKYLFYFISAVITVFAFTKFDKLSFGDIGLKITEDWYINVIKGIILGTIASVIMFMVLFILGYAVPNDFETANLVQMFGKLLGGLIVNFVFIAVGEEILTRGYLFHYLNSKFTASGAILYTSIIYGLVYGLSPTGSGTILVFFNTFLIGIILNLLVMKDKTLWKAIGFHFIWNVISTVLLSTPFMGVRYSGLFGISFRGNEIFTGGPNGVDSGLICTIVLIGFLVFTIFKSKAKEHFEVFIKGLTTRNNIILVVTILLFVFPAVKKDFGVWSFSSIPNDKTAVNKLQKFENVNNYDLKVSLKVSDKKLNCKQTVSYINNSPTPLKEVYFHLYPNGYIKTHDSINFREISSNGKKLSCKVEGRDKSLLRVALPESLQQGKRIKIYMNYNVAIPSASAIGYGNRFGYGKNTYNLGNFYPIAAVYKDGKWDKHLYNKKGDAFYSDIANYNVTINTPPDYIVASSGDLKDATEHEDYFKWKAKAYGVRDFAFVTSGMLKENETKVDGVVIKSYAASGQKSMKALEIGAKAMKFFNKKFGKYPYPSFSIVQSDLIGGMEYPNLIMIDWTQYSNISLGNTLNSWLTGRLKGDFEEVIVHELAHQWWYGIVGNDEFREAWIDEPLTQYSTFLYLKHTYNKSIYDRYISLLRINFKSYNKATKHKAALDRPLDKFKNEQEYNVLIYNKGTLMFKALNDSLGDTKFYSLLNDVYNNYKFKNITGDELIKLTSKVAGKDMSSFYDKWLHTNIYK